MSRNLESNTTPVHESEKPLDVLKEFASSIYDGAVTRPLSWVGVKSKADVMPSPKASGYLDDAHAAGEFVGQTLDIAAVGIVAHGALKKFLPEKPVVGTFQIPGEYSNLTHQFRAFKDRVEVEKPYFADQRSAEPTQHRIDDKRGFIINPDHTARLIDMPSHIQGLGDLTYYKNATTLASRHGTFTRFLDNGDVKHTDHQGQKITFSTDGSYSIRRTDGNLVHFTNDSATHASDELNISGLGWSFNQDGSFSMRSFPSGKNRLHVGADGTGYEGTITGSSRAISGAVRSMDHLPLDMNTRSITYDPETGRAGNYTVPDRTPLSFLTRFHITDARDALADLVKERPGS